MSSFLSLIPKSGWVSVYLHDSLSCYPENPLLLGDHNNRPVPFRLTPALVDFYGVTLHGYMAPAMTALGRCLQQQQLHQWLRVLLWEDDQQQGGDSSGRVERLMTNNGKSMAVLSSRLQGKIKRITPS